MFIFTPYKNHNSRRRFSDLIPLKSSILNTAALVCLPLNVVLHLVLDHCCRTDCLKECTQYSELHFVVHVVNKLPCQPRIFLLQTV